MATELAPPRLYLGVRGVLLANEPPFEVKEKYDDSFFAPEVIQCIGKTGVETVLVSDMDPPELEALSYAINGLYSNHVRALSRYVYKGSSDLNWQAKALLTDQGVSPRPFVWAAEKLAPKEQKAVRRELAKLTVKHLLIYPNPETGLDAGNLAAIKKFVNKRKLTPEH